MCRLLLAAQISGRIFKSRAGSQKLVFQSCFMFNRMSLTSKSCQLKFQQPFPMTLVTKRNNGSTILAFVRVIPITYCQSFTVSEDHNSASAKHQRLRMKGTQHYNQLPSPCWSLGWNFTVVCFPMSGYSQLSFLLITPAVMIWDTHSLKLLTCFSLEIFLVSTRLSSFWNSRTRCWIFLLRQRPRKH